MSIDPGSYLILIEGDGRGTNYSAWSPDLPGCVSTGATVTKTIANMREAIALHLDGLASDGEPVPVPTGPGVYMQVTEPAATAA
jgi:predicted RNase H-like HicB family nuclease